MKDSESLRLEVLNRDHMLALTEMAEEFLAEGDERFRQYLDKPDAFFDAAERFRLGDGLPSDRVQQTHFLFFRERRLLGGARLRHRLIPALHRDGGNIGYEVRRTEREKGYGTRLLALMLEEARRIGLTRVFVTVGKTNRPSIRVVEKNGGVLDGSTISHRTGETMLRYWFGLDAEY